MAEIATHNSLVDAFPFYAEEYRRQNLAVPKASVVFIDYHQFEFHSWGDYAERIGRDLLDLEKYILIQDKTPYLCVADTGSGMTEKVRRYYKVWKTIEDMDLSAFHLGAECEFVLDRHGEKSVMFGAIAEVMPGGMGKALDFISSVPKGHGEMKMRSLLYFSSDRGLLGQEQVEGFFRELSAGRMRALPMFSFDISGTLAAMPRGDVLLVMQYCNDTASTTIIKRG